MVKKFRRAAAGLEEQLPSDLRPPPTLSKTCDYLFNVVLAEQDLAKAHKFLWDRTRAVRNDFTIQQCTKTPDIRIEIDCFERIARFHILSLHQLALPKEDIPTSYDRHQDREQLDKTLLTLMTLYDENRDRYRSHNETEFRAYSILFQMEAIVPNIEDRVQSWPEEIVKHPRVQTALKIYAAATDTSQPLGPFESRACHPIAQSNGGRFFNLIKSNQVSYVMGCVAELVFNMVRKNMLSNIWNAYRIGGDRRVEDWSLEEVTRVLNFDDYEETREFCEAFGFSVLEKDDGTEFLDLTSVQGKILPSAGPNLRKQFRSELIVEAKRHNRTYSAIVNGLTVRQSKERGMIEEQPAGETQPSLFVNQDSESDTEAATSTTSSFTQAANPFAAAAAAAASKNPFAQAASTGFGAPSAPSVFGKPASPVPQSTAFGGFGTPASQGSTFVTPISSQANTFSPFSTASTATTAPALSAASSPFQTASNASTAPLPFAKPTAANIPTGSPATQSPFQLGSQPTPFSAFGQPSQDQASNTPNSSFEQPSDTPPGSPPKSAVFGGMTSSIPGASSSLFPPAAPSLSAAGKGKQPETAAPTSIFGFPPVKTTPVGDVMKEVTSPLTPSSNSIFGFPPVTTKSSAPGIAATTAPASNPILSFIPASSTTSQDGSQQNGFGFTPSQTSGTSPAPDQAPKPASPFPSTTSSTSLETQQQAPQPSLGVFNPSKFSTPPAAQSAPPAQTPFSLGNHTPTPPSEPLQPKADHLPAQQQSFTPASSLTSPLPSFTPASSIAPALAVPQPQKPAPQPDALAIAREAVRRERLANQAIDDITESLVLEPKAGLLTQFIEHMAQKVILESMSQFEDELNHKKADEFRARSLAVKYGQKWRSIWRSEKLRRRGRERRKARRDALNASASRRGEAGIEADVRGFHSSVGASMRRMAASNGSRGDGNVFRDSFSSSVGVSDILERDRRRRPTSSQKKSYLMSGALRSVGSRRSSVQSDNLGPGNSEFRVSKSKKTPIQPPHAQRYRASFLSGQPLIPKESTYTGRISTTQTDYFRLKALGINYEDVHGDKRSRKRYRQFDDDEEAILSSGDDRSASPPERKRRIAYSARDGYRLSQSRTPSGDDRQVSVATSAPSAINKEGRDNLSTDPLLIKFRTIRKALEEGEEFMRSNRQEFEKKASESAPGDPLARSYTSFRASHFPQAQKAATSLPKYWSRESKFLPRSEYGGARWLANKDKGKEKAVEFLDLQAQPAKSSSAQQVPFSQPMNTQDNSSYQFTTFAPGTSNQLEALQPSQSTTSVIPDSNPFVTKQPSNQPTPNGTGTEGDEIMILSSDDEGDAAEPIQSEVPVKSKEIPDHADEDDDKIMEVNHVEKSQSVEEDFESHYESDGQFEEQYQYAQGFETTDMMEDDDEDSVLLDEEDDDEEEQQEDFNEEADEGFEEDNSSQEEEEESGDEDEEIVEDDEEEYEEEESPTDEDSDSRGVTPNSRYKDKGNSAEDAIEL